MRRYLNRVCKDNVAQVASCSTFFSNEIYLPSRSRLISLLLLLCVLKFVYVDYRIRVFISVLVEVLCCQHAFIFQQRRSRC